MTAPDLLVTSGSSMPRMHDLVRIGADRYGDRPCIVHAGRSSSYREVESRVASTARRLLDRGVRNGDAVVTVGRNSDDLVVLYLALSAIGAVNVPLNTMTVPVEAESIASRTSARWIVSGVGFDALAHALAGLETVKGWLRLGADRDPDSVDGEVLSTDSGLIERLDLDDRAEATDTAMVIFTSGSTGRPKGCIKSHRSLVWHAINRQLSTPRRHDDRELFVVPLGGIGFANYVLLDLLAGAAVVVEPFDAELAWRVLEQQHVTITLLAPTMLHAMLAAEPSPASDCGSLRSLETGYEMAMGLRHRVVERFGEIVRYGFGTTEGSISYADPATFVSDPKLVGLVAGVDELRVVGPDGQPVADGEVGEIVVRGPSLFDGYLGDDEATREAFRSGWYHTGDLGRLGDGRRLSFEGRIKDMIKTGGHNVAASEVEEALAQHEGVVQVAVVGLPDDRWGEKIVAAIVGTGGQPDESRLRQHLATRIAKYKQPKAYVMLEELPLNPGGKVAKGTLRDLLAASLAAHGGGGGGG